MKLPGTAISMELLFLPENCSLSVVVFAQTASQPGRLDWLDGFGDSHQEGWTSRHPFLVWLLFTGLAGLSTLFGDYRASVIREMFISREGAEWSQHENSIRGLINEQKRNASPANGLG